MVARLGRKAQGWRGQGVTVGNHVIYATMTFLYTESKEVLAGECFDVVVERTLHSLSDFQSEIGHHRGCARGPAGI